MTEEERLVVNSILGSLCKLVINYKKLIKLNYDVVNYIYVNINKHLVANNRKLRMFRNYQSFRTYFMNEVVARGLASMDSTYNCVFNAGKEQCASYIKNFSNEMSYCDIYYDLLSDYFITQVFKLTPIKKQETLVSTSVKRDVPVSEGGVVIKKSSSDISIEPVNQVINITLNGVVETPVVDELPKDEIIYSSNEGRAIRKVLRK